MQGASDHSGAAALPNAPIPAGGKLRVATIPPSPSRRHWWNDWIDRLVGKPVESVNWFITPWCNYGCLFCFATPKGFENHWVGSDGLLITLDQALRLLTELRDAGARKLTFVGGEPTLVRALPNLVGWAEELGMAPMIFTNGTGLTDQLLDRLIPYLTNPRHPGAIKLSLDSGEESVEAQLGRGRGSHVSLILRRAGQIRSRGIPLMVNTVVTARNWTEDMHSVLRALQPVARWKVFQVLRIEGQNDQEWGALEVSPGQFSAFVERHADLRPIAETTNDMTESYVMVDPVGRFFQNTGGRHRYSQPLFDVGVRRALAEVGWNRSKFIARKGRYAVTLPTQTGQGAP